MCCNGLYHPRRGSTEPLGHRDRHADENIRTIQVFTQGKYHFHPYLTILTVMTRIGSSDQLRTVPNLHRGVCLGARIQRPPPSCSNCRGDSPPTSRMSFHSQRYRVGAVDSWYVHRCFLFFESFTCVKQLASRGSYFYGRLIRPYNRQCIGGTMGRLYPYTQSL